MSYQPYLQWEALMAAIQAALDQKFPATFSTGIQRLDGSHPFHRGLIEYQGHPAKDAGCWAAAQPIIEHLTPPPLIGCFQPNPDNHGISADIWEIEDPERLRWETDTNY